jgi:hypothetical protein
MTIAEIHGKLIPSRTFHERAEDLLTADVFGTMKYAGWRCGFMDWLRSAEAAFQDCRPDSALPANEVIKEIEYRFWPTLGNGFEPDLLLTIRKKTGGAVLVMVEAKYESGPSDRPDASDDGETVEPQEDSQLANQILGFPTHILEGQRSAVVGRVHIYLTAHYYKPMDVFEKARACLKGQRTRVGMFWLSWRSLADELRRHLHKEETPKETARPMLADLVKLLDYKGLVPYEGFGPYPVPEWDMGARRPFWGEGFFNFPVPALPRRKTGFWRS